MRRRSIPATSSRSPRWCATCSAPRISREQSYSERQIFEAACSRLARELAAMEQVDEPTAQEKILDILRKAAIGHNK